MASPMATQASAPGLRKVTPYWYPYTTMAKERWWGREILEVVSTEFRERSMEYYVCTTSLRAFVRLS
jgi:tRNA pseudouridine synthase 9